MKKLTDKQLDQFLKNTEVKDEDGRPLVVYRGEHGAMEGAKTGLQTVLGTYSFGGHQTASGYAIHPNNRTMTPHQSRVFPVYLRVNKPFVGDPKHPNDPFLDFTYVEKQLGHKVAVAFFIKHGYAVEHTDNWDDINKDKQFKGIEDFYNRHPERMKELYANTYHFLDDLEFIAVLKAKGFDGAISGGTGANAMEVEYRVFDASNIVFALSQEIAAAPTKIRRLEPAEMAI
jgi:hypothetical protein